MIPRTLRLLLLQSGSFSWSTKVAIIGGGGDLLSRREHTSAYVKSTLKPRSICECSGLLSTDRDVDLEAANLLRSGPLVGTSEVAADGPLGAAGLACKLWHLSFILCCVCAHANINSSGEVGRKDTLYSTNFEV